MSLKEGEEKGDDLITGHHRAGRMIQRGSMLPRERKEIDRPET